MPHRRAPRARESACAEGRTSAPCMRGPPSPRESACAGISLRGNQPARESACAPARESACACRTGVPHECGNQPARESACAGISLRKTAPLPPERGRRGTTRPHSSPRRARRQLTTAMKRCREPVSPDGPAPKRSASDVRKLLFAEAAALEGDAAMPASNRPASFRATPWRRSNGWHRSHPTRRPNVFARHRAERPRAR